ncbi:hypothetical protein K9L63_02845 [Candidatus Gracilibacteria bacterium]|nr:hypothetical protein [Candidatus Gracilibacteria bacterium]
MKRLLFGIFIGGIVFGLLPQKSASAEMIQGLKVSLAGKYALVEWTPLADQILYNTDGYALQISSNESKMRNIDTTEKLLFVQDTESSLSLFWPALFNRNEYYYLRIYTYVKEGRDITLTNGSKLLKFQVASVGDELKGDPETIEPNDPVIADSANNDAFNFGKLSVKNPLDEQVDFFWSRPKNMSDNDFDKFLIIVSKEESLAHPVIKARAGQNVTSMQLKGLEPNTTYYAKGFFMKETAGEVQEFGGSELEKFSTVAPLTSDQQSRLTRLLGRGIITLPDTVVTIGESTNTSTTDNTTTSSTSDNSTPNTSTSTPTTSSNTTSPSTTTNTSSSSSSTATINGYTRAQVLSKIQSLQEELERWEQRLQQFRSSSTSNASSVTNQQTTRVSPPILTNTTKSTGKSLRQIICEKLGRTNCH